MAFSQRITMKFTIPFNMCAFLAAASKSQLAPDLGVFVWGYRINSPVVWIGIYKTIHREYGHTYYTIDLLDGGRIDVDAIVTIPNQLLPYVVARDNKVHRVQYVVGDTLTTTHDHQFKFDEVQPVLYRKSEPSGLASAPARPVPSEPDLPNRVREEGV